MCAVGAVLLSGAAFAVFKPFAVDIDLPSQAKKTALIVEVAPEYASQVRIVCENASAASALLSMAPADQAGSLRIDIPERAGTFCEPGQSPAARLRAELSIWQIAIMEMER